MAVLYLHNVRHFVQGGDSHVPPAEVVHTDAVCHEGLWVIAEARRWQNTPATVGMLSNFLQVVSFVHSCMHPSIHLSIHSFVAHESLYGSEVLSAECYRQDA